MFSHVALGTDNLEESKAFYDAVLGTLGIAPGMQISPERVLYTNGAANFLLTKPINGEPACHANGGTVGFACASPEVVEAWHAAGVANGGTSCEDAPGVRNAGGPSAMYLAYLRDPADNKLCALHFIGNAAAA
jgi:catechol 2,3-dioxygenase-like lactoylglutathione lyase family enzyme